MGDWQAGDLALCVNNRVFVLNGIVRSPDGLVMGRVYEVAAVRLSVFDRSTPVLHLRGDDRKYGRYGRLASRFRKIHPHTPDAEDAETIYQLVYAPSPQFTEG